MGEGDVWLRLVLKYDIGFRKGGYARMLVAPTGGQVGRMAPRHHGLPYWLARAPREARIESNRATSADVCLMRLCVCM